MLCQKVKIGQLFARVEFNSDNLRTFPFTESGFKSKNPYVATFEKKLKNPKKEIVVFSVELHGESEK